MAADIVARFFQRRAEVGISCGRWPSACKPALALLLTALPAHSPATPEAQPCPGRLPQAQVHRMPWYKGHEEASARMDTTIFNRLCDEVWTARHREFQTQQAAVAVFGQAHYR